MGMMNEGLSIADAMALANGRDGDMFGGNGSGAWVFFLFFLLAWGGNGFFGNRGMGAESPALQGALTRGDLCESFNFNDMQRQIQGVQKGLYDGFYAMNTGIMNGFHGVDNALCQGFNGVNSAINQARFDAQQCC